MQDKYGNNTAYDECITRCSRIMQSFTDLKFLYLADFSRFSLFLNYYYLFSLHVQSSYKTHGCFFFFWLFVIRT